MNVEGIIVATLIIGLVGLFIGLLLGVAGKIFAVKVDEKELAVRELLPGNNCGGCGFAGCDALAKAIAAGTAEPDACPVAGEERALEISAIIGKKAGNKVKKIAFVKCHGTCDKTTKKYNYEGLHDCQKLALIPGRGEKACAYGCMGLGSCVRACPFDAIHIQDGIASVDALACKGCGKCVEICPNHLIELRPATDICAVACSSHDKGKDVKAVCQTGCIGCGICVKQCDVDAITLENNLAYIDPSKCIGCGACKEKCPVKVIQ